MASSVNNLTLLINRQDANGTNVENRSVGAVSYSGVAGELDIRQAPDANLHSLDLPTPVILQFYFKNTHATAIVTLTGTVQGGASQTISKVGPGGVFAYWAPTTGATLGYTALSYQSDMSGSTFEMFLGG